MTSATMTEMKTTKMSIAKRLLCYLTEVSEMIPKWNRDTAGIWLKELSPIARRAGYKIKLVGSVAERGFSNKDVDFLITPFRDDFDSEAFVEGCKAIPNISRVVEPYENDEYGTMMAIWLDQSYVIDIFFGED